MFVRPILVFLLALLGAVQGTPAVAAPPIHYVFVIVLENEDAATSFGASSPAPYLAHDLTAAGAYIPNYYGIGHASLDNYIAMVSGQAPNPQTQADCPIYTDLLPGALDTDGQAVGSGCVYPSSVQTIADQLDAAGLSWKGYMEDMGADPSRDGGTTCAHPAIGSRDTAQAASANDQYATRHNPFVYFHSIIDRPGCAANDVGLDRLSGDLQSAATTPSLAFITPDLCHDGHDQTCADGGPGGLKAADGFLKTWVPRITSSPAFHDGMLVVTFDEASSDSTACCGEPSGPNTPASGGSGGGKGGGKVGAVVLSPFVKPGTKTTTAYNHYSLLRSMEDVFSLPALGYAGMSGLPTFGADVYTNAAGTTDVPTALTGRSGDPAGAGCRAAALKDRPRHLPAGTLLRNLRLTRAGGRRFVTFQAGHAASVTFRVGSWHRVTRVAACRRYRVRVAGQHGAVRVAAVAGGHSERRTLR